MMPIPFEVYVCSMIFFSMMSAVGGAIVGIIVALFVNVQPVILEYLIPFGAAVGFGAMTFGMLYIDSIIQSKDTIFKTTWRKFHTLLVTCLLWLQVD